MELVLKKIILLLVSIAALSSCTSLQKYPKVAENQNFAVVGYSIERLLSHDGKKEEPSYIKSVEQRDENFREFQEAADKGIEQLETELMNLFTPDQMIAFDQVTGNSEYQAVTAYTPNIKMGMDLSPKGSYITPAGMGQINFYEKDTLKAIAQSIPATYYLLIDNSIEIAGWNGIGIGSLSGGTAKLELTSRFTMVDAEQNQIWTTTYSGQSDSTTAYVGELFDLQDLAPMYLEAQLKVIDKFKTSLEKGKLEVE
jgi:hypothetical protein